MKILVLESSPEVRKEFERAFQRIRGEVRLPDSWDIGVLTTLASNFKPDFTVMEWRIFGGGDVLTRLKALSGEV